MASMDRSLKVIGSIFLSPKVSLAWCSNITFGVSSRTSKVRATCGCRGSSRLTRQLPISQLLLLLCWWVRVARATTRTFSGSSERSVQKLSVRVTEVFFTNDVKMPKALSCSLNLFSDFINFPSMFHHVTKWHTSVLSSL